MADTRTRLRRVPPVPPEAGTSAAPTVPATAAPPAPPGPGGRRAGRRLGPGDPIRFGPLLGPALLLGAWAAGSATGLLDPRFLPAPWTIAGTAIDLIESGRLQENLLTSLQRVGLGLAFGTVLGTVLAVVSGLSRWGESIIDGPVQIKRAIPTLALMPLLILWLGIGEGMKITTITLGVLVHIYIQTHNGLRSIDSRYVELAETLRLTHRDFIRKVVLPGALPGFLIGMRFAVTAAWLFLAVVEQINSTSGIGYMMDLARSYGQTDVIFVGIVLYGLLGLVSDAAVRLVQRRALAWRRTLAG
ncbi:ABC transporter permease [Thermobispora bispora]|jgi:sulfonate transport system permease protein|uniref:ABC transporter permease n=1 Tax=Thermobispora bispora TaxID=2006 RepID=UPI0030EADC8A|nr:ABC transporter permease [Actinomycetales bacterium]MDI9580580.1 ABC transporter permease [Thermobispora sp.]